MFAKKYTYFILVFFFASFFILTNSAQAIEQTSPFGGYTCDDRKDVTDCHTYFSNGSLGDYQLYKIDVSGEYQGYEGDGEGRIDICISANQTVWSSPGFCWLLLDAQYGKQTFALPNKTFQIPDVLDPVKYFYAPAHIRVDSAKITLNVTLHYRHVSADSISYSPSGEVKVGDTFFIDWGIGWATEKGEILYNGAAGDGSVILSYEKTQPTAEGKNPFKAQTAGPAYFTLKAIGIGGAGLDTATRDFVVNIVPTPTPSASPLSPGPFVLQNTTCQGDPNSNWYVDLAWTQSQNAANYDIYQKQWSTGVWQLVDQDLSYGESPFRINNPAQGVDWYYKVRAFGYSSSGQVDSNEIFVNCPRPATQVVCSPKDATISPGQSITFTGSDGDDINYSWSQTGGTPGSGEGKDIRVFYSNTGEYSPKVSSGGTTDICPVHVKPGSGPEKVECSPLTQSVVVGQVARINALKGDGNYSWLASGGDPSSATGSNLGVSYNSAGNYSVVVSSAGSTATCGVSVTPSSVNKVAFVNSVDMTNGSEVRFPDGIFKKLSPDSYTENTQPWPKTYPNLTDGTYTIELPYLEGATHVFDHTENMFWEPRTPATEQTISNSRPQIGWTIYWRPKSCSSSNGTVKVVSSDQSKTWTLKRPSGYFDLNGQGSEELKNQPLGNYEIFPQGLASSTQTLYCDGTIVFALDYGGGIAGGTCNVNVAGAPSPSSSIPPSPSSSAGPGGSTPAVNSVNVVEPNYCVAGPAATVTWSYSDPSGSPQTAYQVQIDEQGSFNSPEVDSGKVQSGSNSYFSGSGYLQFNTTYKSRVRVWNSYDNVSAWLESASWKTPAYAYPQVDFTWSPAKPDLNIPIQFTDQTVFSGPSNGRSWSWSFGDGSSSTQQNPVYTYTSGDNYYVTLAATDNANQTCSRTKGPIRLQKAVPIWKEVAPR